MSEKKAPDTTNVQTQSAPQPETGSAPLDSTVGGGTQVQNNAPAHLFSMGLPAVPGYTVTREVARGGMGVVYAAHDPTFDREVAVKVMHAGQDGERFVIESKVTAQLPHPGIPPVYALGTLLDGRPYLAMKLIHGHTLDDELKAAPRADLPRLLGAFEQICLTVGFAHSKGIVHRDLKPSNVMVGNFGEVLVMDWGLAKNVGTRPDAAKVQERSEGPQRNVSETLAGQVKGTPAYMAPEQARSEPVDARADVFALGGILAVMLTGRPPFLGETAMDTVLKAALAETGECFAALDTCGADTELIELTKTCLAVAPTDRPTDGTKVAATVALYRAGVEERLRGAERERTAAEAKAREEVNTRREAEARADAERAKVIEQRKRRRTQLMLVAAVFLLALGAGGFAWWRDKQADERKLADERAAAERKMDEERAAAERKMVEERAAAERRRIESNHKTEQARLEAERQLADERAAAANQKIESERTAAQAKLEAERKLAQAQLESERKLADERAATERQRLEGDRKATQARLDAEQTFKVQQARQGVAANLKLSDDLRKQYKFKEAGAALAQAGEMAKGAPELLPKVEEARRDLALVVQLDDIRYRKWMWISEEGGRGDFNTRIAAPEYKKALADHGLNLDTLDPKEAAKRIAASAVKPELVAAVDDWALHEPDPAVRDRLLKIVRAADPGAWLDRLRDSAVWKDKAALAKLATDADPATTSPAALSALAELMSQQRVDPTAMLAGARARYPSDFDLAFALGQKHNRSKDGRQIGPYEAARALRPDNITAWHNLGAALADTGDVDGAILAYKGALKLAPHVAMIHNNLGNALADKGDTEGAIAAYKEAIKQDPRDAFPHTNLGRMLSAKGDVDGAIAAHKEAIRLNPKFALAHNNLGNALWKKEDSDGAIAEYKEAIRLNPKYAVAHSNLGNALRKKGDLDGAIAEYKEAVKLDPQYAPAHNNLGVVYLDQKKYPEALASARAAIRADPKHASAYAIMADALLHTGDIPGARAALTEAARLDPKKWGPKLDALPPDPVPKKPRDGKQP